MSESKAGRVTDALFGTFILALAVAVLVLAWHSSPIAAAIAALVLGFLGVEAIVSAVRCRRSLLSRIGPLP
jgi:Flp pilus assembly protein TadB